MQTQAPRHPDRFPERQAFRLLAALTGVVFLASAALAADLARAHMLELGTVCGAGHAPHCAWCLGAASLVLAGLAAFAAVFAYPQAPPACAVVRARWGHPLRAAPSAA